MGILDRVLSARTRPPIAPRADVRRRGELRPGGRHVLLRLDGHRPEGRATASTSRSPRCSRTAATTSSSRSAATRGAEVLAELDARAGGRRRGRAAPSARTAAGRRADGPRDGRHGHPRAALPQPRAPALGRRRRALPDLRQLHDGVPDLLLHDGRGRRPTSPASTSSATSAGTRASRSTTRTCTAAASARSARSRYRQWMTHKLATWFDQFGSSGCVGCGRCITWCPVGIDITEEVAAIRASEEAHALDR